MRATFGDDLTRDQGSARLRTALSLDGDWLPTVLGQAHDRLRSIRQQQPDAGGLVIATDQEHAQGIVRLLRNRFNVVADVVVSDDPGASKKIAEFTVGDRPWLVAVRMVSEGVDIPRLRVGVYATTTSTELFFRQAVGRFVRWQAGRAEPEGVRLHPRRSTAASCTRSRSPKPAATCCGRRPSATTTTSRSMAGWRQLVSDDDLFEQLSLFSVVSSTATGISVHGVTEDGVQFFDEEPDPPDPMFATDPTLARRPAGDPDRGRQRRVEFAQRRRAEGRPAHPQRRRRQAARRHHRLGPRQGAGRDEPTRRRALVSTATIDQLERRLRYSESWLRRLRGS